MPRFKLHTITAETCLYKSPHVFTMSLIAPHIGLSSDELGDLSYSNLNVEDGLMWIIGAHEHEEMVLTVDGIANIAKILTDLGNEKAAYVASRIQNGKFFRTPDPA